MRILNLVELTGSYLQDYSTALVDRDGGRKTSLLERGTRNTQHRKQKLDTGSDSQERCTPSVVGNKVVMNDGGDEVTDSVSLLHDTAGKTRSPGRHRGRSRNLDHRYLPRRHRGDSGQQENIGGSFQRCKVMPDFGSRLVDASQKPTALLP